MTGHIRLGFIGLGNRSRSLIRAATESDFFEVIAGSHGTSIEDSSFALIKRSNQTNTLNRPGHLPEPANYFADWRDLLDSNIDAVIISTPNDLHSEMVLAAMAAGVHIFCEKPLAITATETIELWSKINDYPKVFQLGMELRFAPPIQDLISTIKSEPNRQPVLIWMQEFRPQFRSGVNNWRQSLARTGGTFLEKNSHHFDLFALIFKDRPISVLATSAPDSKIPGLIDQAMVMVGFAKGGVATLNLDLTQIAETLRLGVLGQGWQFEYDSQTHSSKFQPLQQPSTNHKYWGETLNPQASGWDHLGEVEQFEVFARRINGETDPTIDRTSPIWSHLIAFAAERSIRSGEIVRINEDGWLS